MPYNLIYEYISITGKIIFKNIHDFTKLSKFIFKNLCRAGAQWLALWPCVHYFVGSTPTSGLDVVVVRNPL